MIVDHAQQFERTPIGLLVKLRELPNRQTELVCPVREIEFYGSVATHVMTGVLTRAPSPTSVMFAVTFSPRGPVISKPVRCA